MPLLVFTEAGNKQLLREQDNIRVICCSVSSQKRGSSRYFGCSYGAFYDRATTETFYEFEGSNPAKKKFEERGYNTPSRRIEPAVERLSRSRKEAGDERGIETKCGSLSR